MLYAQPKNFWKLGIPVVLFDLRTWNVEKELEFNFNEAKKYHWTLSIQISQHKWKYE